MNNFVKKVTSALLSAVLVATGIFPAPFKGELKNAEAYSNAKLFVDTAKKLDYISGRPNEATAHYNAPACDWCAMFVHLAAYRCGLGDKIPMLSYCDNQYYTVDGVQMDGYRSYYERRGQFLYASSYLLPEIGDLIIFDSASAYDGKGDHIGIVINVDSYTGLIYTIEGNGRGDKVVYEQYPYFDSSIIGYCQTNLDSYTETVTPAPPVTPSQPAGPELPAIDMNNTSWEVTSPIGCNLRYTPNGEKIGVITTGTILKSDPSKNQGEWIYVKAANMENGGIHDGYVHCSTVSPESDKKPVTTTAVSTTATETTTTTAVSTETDTSESTTASTTSAVSDSTAISTTAATAATAQPQPPAVPEYSTTATHYISSLIGANGRTAPEFDENNIARIVDTDTLLIVNYYENDFAYCTIPDTGETYFIHSSVISQLPTSEDDYTECARVNYYVSSDCGVKLRAYGDYNGEVLCILDTYQDISVLTSPNELGFVLVEFTFGDGVIHNGYVHIDHITAY